MSLGQTESDVSGGKESWEKAKKIAQKIGYVPASFSIAVRTLIGDQFKNDGIIRPVTKFQVARLFHTPSFKSMLYYATKALHPEALEGKERITIGDMMDAYQPMDLAVLIPTFVLYRKSRRALNEQWGQISQDLDQNSQIGAQLGASIPRIGMGSALLMSTVRMFALATMIQEDIKAFREYKMQLKKSGESFDFDLETQLWGCSSQQIGVIILTNFGFGVDIAQAFSSGIDPKSNFAHLQDELPRRMKIANLWLHGIISGQDQPLQKVPGEYYPLEEARKVLNARVDSIRASTNNWLNSGKEDISPEKTPVLFAKKAGSEEEVEVPDELQDVFSLDEITAMEETDFDDLIDQIDAENEGNAPKGSTILSNSDIDELEDIVD